MLRDEAVEIIAFKLGNRSDLNNAIVRELKYQQVLLEGKPSVPWFLLSEVSTALTEIGESRVPLPVDFLREPEEESALWLYTTNTSRPWFPLEKSQFDKATEIYQGRQTKPQVYSISSGYFRLTPAPDAIYTLKMLYYRKARKLDTNIENEWLLHAPSVLVGATGLSLAVPLGNTDAAQGFTNEFTLANNNLTVENTARQEANRTRVMGERP